MLLFHKSLCTSCLEQIGCIIVEMFDCMPFLTVVLGVDLRLGISKSSRVHSDLTIAIVAEGFRE